MNDFDKHVKKRCADGKARKGTTYANPAFRIKRCPIAILDDLQIHGITSRMPARGSPIDMATAEEEAIGHVGEQLEDHNQRINGQDGTPIDSPES